ncbi:MAG TPA: hypothetical protein VE133_19260 [Candidatus Sulfotelmatobacter sp.]|nr:hypothetical protein [Candidatus Sulfotelmatobacter sp.]
MAAANVKLSDESRSGAILTWTAAIFACVYFAWACISLYLSTPVFIKMYGSMGVELRLSTKLVIAGYRLFYPCLLGGATALVIAKQFFIWDKWLSVTVTLATVLVFEIRSRRHCPGVIPPAC